MAEPIDIAYVEIRPDTRGFAAETARQINRALGRVPDAQYDVAPDTRGFAAQASREVQAALRSVPAAQVEVDPLTTGFGADARLEIERELRTIVPPGVRLDPDTRGFAIEAAREIEADLRRIRHPTVNIDPDLTGFAAETQAKVDAALLGVTGDVRVSPNLSGRAEAGAASRAAEIAALAAATGGGADIGSRLGVRGAEKDFLAATAGVRGFNTEIGKAATGLATVNPLLGRVGGGLRGVTAGAATSAAVGIGAVVLELGLASKAAIDYESAFTGVAKTVNATDEVLAQLSDQFRELSTIIPVSASDLARIGELGGQLGISTGNLVKFTEVIAGLASATNLTAEEAALAIAKFSEITGLPQSQFENLGSTIVDLGNNFATTEADITEFGLRLAGSGTLIGLAEPEILAIGTALSSIGVEAEAGGTAVQKVLLSIRDAADGLAPEKLKVFADTVGVTQNQFKQLVKDDPAKAFLGFVEGLASIEAQGGSANSVLKNLGLTDQRLARSFLGLATGGDVLARAIDTANTAFDKNTALSDEVARRYKTTASQVQILKNNINDLQVEIGSALLPGINATLGSLTDFVRFLRDSDDAANLVKDGISNLGAVYKPIFDAIRKEGPAIRDAFFEIANAVDKTLVALRPLAAFIGVSLAVQVRVAIKAVQLLANVFGFLADVVAKEIQFIVKNLDLFLGGLTILTDAASKLPFVGDQFKGVSDKINAAREELRSLSAELNGLDGQTVNVEITVTERRRIIQEMIAPFGGNAGAEARAVAPPSVRGAAREAAVPGATTTVQPLSPAAVAAREAQLQDNLALARVRTQSLADDRTALNDLIAFAKEASENQRLKADVRRQYLIDYYGYQNDLRQTYTDEKDAAKSAAEDAADAAKEKADAARAEREAVLSANVELARLTTQTLEDDKKAVNAQIAYWRKRVGELSRATSEGKRALIELKNARAELRKINDEIRDDRREEKEQRIRDTEETLKDRLTLAQFTEPKGDDLKALKALERFYGRRVRASKRFSKEQRKWRIELRRIQKDIRDLKKEEADAANGLNDATKRSFAQATFDFLQRQQGFTSQYLGNLLVPGAVAGIKLSSETTPTGGAAKQINEAGREFAGGRRGPSESLTAVQAAADKKGMTQGQANTLIALNRQMLNVLTAVERGGSTPEATGAMRASRAGMEIL